MKMYVDKMPKSCAECEHCTKYHKDNYGMPYCLIARMPLYNGNKIYEETGQHKGSLSDFDLFTFQLKQTYIGEDKLFKIGKCYKQRILKGKEQL